MASSSSYMSSNSISIKAQREKRERLLKYMHAFASLISMENAGCDYSFIHGHEVCVFDEEEGWRLNRYLPIHKELLSIIENDIARDPCKLGSDLNDNLYSFIDRQKRKTQEIITINGMYNERRTAKEHISFLLRRLRTKGDNITYPWGTIDHQIYIDFWNKGGYFNVRIFDLGAGREDEPIRKAYQPIEKKYDLEELKEFIKLLVEKYNNESTEDLFREIYGENPSVCHECVPEVKQKTDNCVVKNLLAAIKQDAIDLYEEERGQLIFKNFYLSLIKASLIKANQNIDPMFDIEFPLIKDIARYILRSQSVFTGVECNDIISGPIAIEYDKLCNGTSIRKSIKVDAPNSLFFRNHNSLASSSNSSLIPQLTYVDHPANRPNSGCC
jgi:hypothetical protein